MVSLHGSLCYIESPTVLNAHKFQELRDKWVTPEV